MAGKDIMYKETNTNTTSQSQSLQSLQFVVTNVDSQLDIIVRHEAKKKKVIRIRCVWLEQARSRTEYVNFGKVVVYTTDSQTPRTVLLCNLKSYLKK